MNSLIFLTILTPRTSPADALSHTHTRGNVIHQKEQKEMQRTAERLKGRARNLLGSRLTLKVGSGDGASIRGLFTAAADSETLFLVAGELASWQEPELKSNRN